MKKIKTYIKEIIKYAVFLFVIVFAVNYYKTYDLNKEKFSLQNVKLITGFNSTYPKDEVVVVHFWATWCPICKIEKNNIERIAKDYNVLTIAGASGGDEAVLKHIFDNNIKFDVLNDKHNIYAKKFNVQAYPTTFIYDKNGNLAFSEVGYISTFGLKIRIWWASL